MQLNLKVLFEQFKNGSTDPDAVWVEDSDGPRNHILGEGPGNSMRESGPSSNT